MITVEHPERSMEQIGLRLRALREAVTGQNQAEFCRRVKIATNTWNQYESGTSRPQIDIAFRLYDELGVTLDWIYLADGSCLPSWLALKVAKPLS